MKIKMWCLVNTKRNQVMTIGINEGCYVIGFETKSGLLSVIDFVEHDEKIEKIEIEV